MIVGSYVRWGYNKPNNFGGYQTCGAMLRSLDFKFDDDKCGQTKASYICEISTHCTIGFNSSFLLVIMVLRNTSSDQSQVPTVLNTVNYVGKNNKQQHFKNSVMSSVTTSTIVFLSFEAL